MNPPSRAGFLQPLLDECPAEPLPSSLPAIKGPGEPSQWDELTLKRRGVHGIVDVFDIIPTTDFVCYLVVSDGYRYLVAVASLSTADLAKWKSIGYRPVCRAAVIVFHEMTPPSPASVDRRLLRYIKQVNGTPQVLQINEFVFQGRGPVLDTPQQVFTPYSKFDLSGLNEAVQHDSFYDETQRLGTFVGVRARQFRPIDDGSEEESIEEISAELEIPGSI